MRINHEWETIVGSISTARRTLSNHLRAPRAIAIVQLHVIISSLKFASKHPGTIRCAEALGVAGIVGSAHHVIARHCQLSILFSVCPVLHGEVGARLQAVGHREVGGIYVVALIVGQISLGLVKVREDKRESLLVGHTRVIVVLIRCSLGNHRHCLGVLIGSIRLVSIHTHQVEIHHSAQGISLTEASILVGGGVFARHRDEHVAVFNPAVIIRPRHLRISIAGSNARSNIPR